MNNGLNPEVSIQKKNFHLSPLSDLRLKTCKSLEVTSSTEVNILKDRHQEKYTNTNIGKKQEVQEYTSNTSNSGQRNEKCSYLKNKHYNRRRSIYCTGIIQQISFKFCVWKLTLVTAEFTGKNI